MKKSILAIAFLALATVACKTKADEKKVETKAAEEVVEKVDNPIGAYKANIADSKITWIGTKLSGSSHNGDMKITSGVFDIEDGAVKVGEFVIDMNSINCLDLEGGKKEKLEGHLKNADFFETDKFPTAKFVITGSEVKDGKTLITGNLTLKDITKSISIPATVTETDGIATIKSDAFKIDRTEFGVTYKSNSIDAALKDKAINDLMEMSIEVVAKK